MRVYAHEKILFYYYSSRVSLCIAIKPDKSPMYRSFIINAQGFTSKYRILAGMCAGLFSGQDKAQGLYSIVNIGAMVKVFRRKRVIPRYYSE